MKSTSLHSVQVDIYFIYNFYTGQLSSKEELITIHSCDLSTVSISCENGQVIAAQSLDFQYEPTCEHTCCNFNSSHKKSEANAIEISDVRRVCSGRQTCTIDVRGTRIFGDVGTHEPVYVIIQTYCIPGKNLFLVFCSHQV
jgi:hypothetical protein